MIHIPLSRMHSSFSFLTALIPIMLNIRTKYYFYERTNRVVCWIMNKFTNDPEAINHVKKPNNIKYQEEQVVSMDVMSKPEKKDFSLYLKLSRDEYDQQENCVWATNYFLAFFFSCLFSFFYKVFLQELLVSTNLFQLKSCFLDRHLRWCH